MIGSRITRRTAPPCGDLSAERRPVLSRFFISYTGSDGPWAQWIAFQLEAAGHQAVIQAWDFLPGRDFVVEMQKALTECDCVVAVLSRAYPQSNFATWEWTAAMGGDPLGASRRLIPVRVEDVVPPGLLHNRVYIDLVGLSEEQARDALLTGVGEQRAKPATVPFPGQVRSAQPPPSFPGAPASTSHVLPITTLSDADVLARAVAVLPSFRSGSSGMLHIAVATDAAQRLMRPSDFDGETLAASLQQLALFGAPVLDVGEGVQVNRETTGLLTLEQRDARVAVDERGTVVVTLPAVRRSRTMGLLSSLIEEDVTEDIERCLVFASRALDLLDTSSTIQSVAVAAVITGGAYLGWRTRAEQQAIPHSMSMSVSAPDPAIAQLDRVYRRAGLLSQARKIALDLTALLGRSLRGH